MLPCIFIIALCTHIEGDALEGEEPPRLLAAQPRDEAEELPPVPVPLDAAERRGNVIQGPAKRWSPGCVNTAGKARQKW